MLTPPLGTVTVQSLPEKALQPVQITVPPPVGIAVSPTDAPTGNSAMHGPDGQLMPPVRLVTVPSPTGETCTLNVASVPPPGQIGLVGSSTVTVAYPTTTFCAPPVPSGAVAVISIPPQPPCP